MRFIWWVAVVSFFTPTVFAFVAGQVRPGVIELRSEAKGGLQVHTMVVRSRGTQDWLYFCVVDKGLRKKQRCFYAKQKRFPGLRAGDFVNRIEYSLGPRIHNKNGWIAIGQQRYFYPVKVVGTRVP
ncbi:MAG: hypothetical protein ABL958_06035 [Bdellovibrionia bacterium]